jgi:threonine dehydrogenase-like Zn-dependent dehydrogenase
MAKETMKAFVMKKIGEVGVIDKPVPDDPDANDAIIKATAALICTSDVHTVKGAIGERTDQTLGHEACGVVDRVGSAVTLFKPGDRIVSNAITANEGLRPSVGNHWEDGNLPTLKMEVLQNIFM